MDERVVRGCWDVHEKAGVWKHSLHDIVTRSNTTNWNCSKHKGGYHPGTTHPPSNPPTHHTTSPRFANSFANRGHTINVASSCVSYFENNIVNSIAHVFIKQVSQTIIWGVLASECFAHILIRNLESFAHSKLIWLRICLGKPRGATQMGSFVHNRIARCAIL